MSTDKSIVRKPTREELRQDVWRPEEPEKTFVRKKWGVGWSINFFRLLRRR